MVRLGNIDDDLINALRYGDYAWIKKIIGKGRISVLPEEEIGNKRCCDLLVNILNYDLKGIQKVSIEVENDREFDASAILRKIKKDQPYPTIVIIPHSKTKDAWRFQESMIKVWYWKAKIGWKCKKCNASFTSISSIMPKCEKCRNAQCEYERAKPEDVDFMEDNNNPTMTFGEIQNELDRRYSNQSDKEALKQLRFP